MATKDKKRSRSEIEKQIPNSASATKHEAVVEEQKVESLPATKRKAAPEEIEVDLEAPEPPSKRAKRALKKGKALPKKPTSDDDDEDLTKDGAADDDKKLRGEHGVWIGNLPFTVTPSVLKAWLVDNSGGVITAESITRIKLPKGKVSSRDKDAKPANKGFAYVDFTDLGGKVAAIALTESAMGGRRLLIKDSTSFEGRPKKDAEPAADGADGKQDLQGQKAAFKKEMDASRKIFVGNMGFKTTEDDVWRNFEKCGEIEFVKVATFEDTGKCKGFGWVRFKDPEAAAWAVKGFVKIKEQVETEDDFKGSDDEEAGEGEERQKHFKTRKWWVNRMLGRELKIELAEDDKSRYQKRFGKGAQSKGDRPDGKRNNRQGDEAMTGATTEQTSRPLQEATDIQVARLTGAVVKSTGTKVTFDS